VASTIHEAVYHAGSSTILLLLATKFYGLISTAPKPSLGRGKQEGEQNIRNFLLSLHSLFLNATPKHFKFPNLPKFQTMYQPGHVFLRRDIPVVPPE
jgi:hypothetical protein